MVPTSEELFRIQYFDCEPFEGSVKLPISGMVKRYSASNTLLTELSREELVAVRRGLLKFRGWERTRSSLKSATAPSALKDDDFKPKWEQKGVDLRIGLDLVTMTESRAVELIVLVTGDTEHDPRDEAGTWQGLTTGRRRPPQQPHCS